MTVRNKLFIVTLAVALALFLGLAAVSQEDDAADQKYTIQVVTNPDFAPYEYMVADKYEGIDMDIWKAISKALGCDVNFNVMDFDSIINAIEAGKYDVGASGFTVTDERKQQVNFSDTYSTAHQVAMVLKDGPLANAKDYTELLGHKVGVESGTTGYYLAVDVFDEKNVTPYNTYTDVIEGLKRDYVSVVVIDDLVAESFAEKDSNLKILDVEIPGDEIEEYAFVINKTNYQMLQYTNRAMDYLMGMGVIDDIFAYYGSIGYDPEEYGYFTAHPEKLDEIDVVIHYQPTTKYTIEVATNPDFPPYDYTVSGDYEGIDMDIWKAIAYVLDCNVNFNFMEFDSIINAIQSERYEVGASGFTVTDERKEMINFSNTYAVAHQNVLLRTDSPLADAKSWEDLKGVTISVESGTTGYYLAADVYGDSYVAPYNTYTDVVQSVLTKQSAFAVIDDLVAVSYVEAHPDELKILNVELPGAEAEEYAFVFNKKNTELLGYTNKAMSYLEEKGIINDIYAYYGEISYDPATVGYFSAHPEALSKLDVLVHYVPGEMKTTVQVATNPDFPPYDYMVSKSYEGIDMDIWKAIGHTMDFDVNFNFMEFDSIINAIASKQYDVGASGFTVTDERKQTVNFSSTYAVAYQKVLILKNSPLANAKTWEDLKNLDLAVESGTTGYYLSVDDFGDSYVHPFNTYTEVVQSVKTGQMKFAVLDDLVAISFVEANSDLMLLDVELPGAEAEEYAFVFNKDSTKLLDYTNRAMAYLEETGVIDDIFAYYGSIGYDPEIEGYFSAHPEALAAIQVIDHYTPDNGGGSDGDQNWFEWLWSEIIKNFVEKDRYELILMGLQNTVYITIIGLALGLLIGIICAIIRSFHDLRGNLKIPNAIARVYITIIRGTPILVQLLIIYFIVFASSGLNSIIIAGIAFGINSGAYVAEIVRAGINAVPKGQLEAAESLGMSFNMAMGTVILPQAIRNILPALCNEGISLLKETSIAGYIGIVDVTKAAMLIRSQTYSAFVPLIGVALIYLVIVLVLQYLVGKLERRLNNAYR
ncbi:MAG: ABC transporter substrate-binding protein/permease [Candidatus Methanomethylophilaceae archaeon]|nr:ABC transporter substrate-binding protein/permease [Candidatus Methanomethylophilaceae archaeon]